MSEPKNSARPVPPTEIDHGPVTHSGVTLTLKSLVCNVGSGLEWFTRPDPDVPGSFLLDASRIVRATHQGYDTGSCLALFEIAENGKPTSNWTIRRHAITEHPDDSTAKWSSHNCCFHDETDRAIVPDSPDRHRFFVSTLDADLLLPGKAAGVKVALQRNDNFSTDEEQIVTCVIPGKGTDNRPGQTLHFWNGDVRLSVVYRRDHTGLNEPDRMRDTIYFLEDREFSQNPLPVIPQFIQAVVIQWPCGAELRVPREDVDLIDLLNFVTPEDDWNQVECLELGRLLEIYGVSPRDPESAFTVNVTVVSPRPFPYEFEFRVVPEEATGEPHKP